MNLETTKRLLSSSPKGNNPRQTLIDVLHSAIELLEMEGNDYAWSGWESEEEAIAEIERLLTLIESGNLPNRLDVAILFAPTGPIQEVSISSGWGETFLKLADWYDYAERALWG
jgi:hypothetical protein